MTRERAKELVPIIAAYAEGKIVETMCNGKWTEAPSLDWVEFACYRIKPEPKMRPMTRGEVLYKVTTTPGMVVRTGGSNLAVPAQSSFYTNNITADEWAIIDSKGDPIDGWHKFEVEE